MLRKLIGAGAILLLLTGVAAAQLPMPGISLGGDNKRKLTPDELKASAERKVLEVTPVSRADSCHSCLATPVSWERTLDCTRLAGPLISWSPADP